MADNQNLPLQAQILEPGTSRISRVWADWFKSIGNQSTFANKLLTKITATDDVYLNIRNEIVEVDATAGDVYVYFPDSTNKSGKHWELKRLDNSAFLVYLMPYGTELIDGDIHKAIRFQNTAVNVYSTGSELRIGT